MKEFSIKASPIAFDILSSKLYSDNVLAIVRELLSNAYDSHKEAGTLDTPIEVYFPDIIKQEFRVRDFGTGLSKEDVIGLYTTFFSSTKSNTNNFTGCFGLGSKTPFSYTDIFTVNSYFNGVKYNFIALKKNGYPHITCALEESTTEHNGLEIIIGTDDNNFYEKAKNYVRFIPEYNISSNKDLRCTYLKKNLNVCTLYQTTLQSYYNLNPIYIKQGLNYFRINDKGTFIDILKEVLKKHIVVIDVPVGTLDITPNREQLNYTEKTAIAIALKLNEVTKLFQQKLVEEDYSLFTDTVKSTLLTEKYFQQGDCKLLTSADNKLLFSLTDVYGISHEAYSKGRIKRHFPLEDSIITIIPLSITYKEQIQLCKNISIIEKNYDVKINLHRFQSLNSDNIKIKDRIISFIIPTLNKEFNINLEYMELDEICKKYPKYKTLNSYYNKLAVKNIGYKAINISTLDINGTRLANDYNYRLLTSTADSIKTNYSPNNTLIVDSSNIKNKEYLLDNVNYFYLIQKLLSFTNRCKQHFFQDYLKSLGIVNTTDFYILSIAKSNLQHFKNYPKLKMVELNAYLINSDFYTYDMTKNINAICDNDQKTKKEDIKKILDFNFKGKTFEVVKNSYLYKWCLKKVIPSNIVLPTNILEKEYQNYLGNWITPFLVKERTKYNQAPNKIPSVVNQFYKYLFSTVREFKSYSLTKELKTKGYSSNNYKKCFVCYRLPAITKSLILNLIRS